LRQDRTKRSLDGSAVTVGVYLVAISGFPYLSSAGRNRYCQRDDAKPTSQAGIMAQAARRQQPQPRPRSRSPRPRYYCVIGGNGHWQPNKRLRQLGFRNKACGPDGPEARAIAEEMNRQATAARLTQDTARAVAAAGLPSAMYEMLNAFTEVNAKHLHQQQSEKFEPQTVEYRAPIRLQTRPPAVSLVGRLRASLRTMFAARR
jgi:hypothetical protein